MDVDFGGVGGLAPELLDHLLGGDAAVVLVVVGLVDVDAVLFAGDGLQEGGAAGAWGAEDDEHLAGVDEGVDAVEDVDAGLFGACELGDQGLELEDGIADGLLVV